MPHWVATSYGALDLRNRPEGAEGAEYAVVPTVPGEPLILLEEAAALWRRLAETADGVDGSTLSDADRALLLEFTASGIASPDLAHPSRTAAPPEPWLSSMFHELVYALVANVCREIGVRAVFIKGPVLRAQGLREREHSGDVDVWVEPGSQLRVAEALEAWGWVPFKADAFTRSVLSHSVALHAPTWACEVDVHYRFPGVGIDDLAAFSKVQQAASPTAFAGVNVGVPDKATHCVINALHLLRPPPGRALGKSAVASAARTLACGGCTAIDAAQALGSTAVLASALEISFPSVVQIDGADAPLPADWQWRTEPTAALALLRGLRLVPWDQRIAVLFRMIWPNAEYALAADRIAGGIPTSAVNARASRLGRGIKECVWMLRQGSHRAQQSEQAASSGLIENGKREP